MEKESILIVGGGIAGLATAWHLARRGARDVCLVEREPALATHSSRKNAAILRTSSDDPGIEELALESADFLRDPPRGFHERPLANLCGVLVAAADEGAEPAAWERRARSDGRAEEVDTARAAAIAPHFAAAGKRCAWFPREGRIDLDALLEGFERGAREGGVRIECSTGAIELLVRGGAVAGARLSGGREVRAERTLLAAGGWAGPLGAAAGSRIRLRPTRRHLAVTAPDPRIDPRWPVVWAEEDAFYARPESGGLLLCACDESPADPDTLAEDPSVRDLALAKSARWLPGLCAPVVARFWSGVRTFADDGRFVIGPDPDVQGLFWAAGLGGHGMVCGPRAGEIAAASLLGDRLHGTAARASDPARFAPATARAP